MPSYLLDTNHVSRLLDGDNRITKRVKQLHTGGHVFGISITVLGELYFAAYASRHREVNLNRLNAFLRDVFLWDYDRPASEEFGRIRAEQKAKGRPIPPTDAQIAAVARLHDLMVLSEDKHFTYINDLKLENWLV
ncbi:MAG: PIN domain-containing protein [Candidatus Latescibacteria bacterium]|nr:PIN domain-containing protein [Candidatus Latescibacterota bacterium]